jgi:hypothetical protein
MESLAPYGSHRSNELELGRSNSNRQLGPTCSTRGGSLVREALPWPDASAVRMQYVCTPLQCMSAALTCGDLDNDRRAQLAKALLPVLELNATSHRQWQEYLEKKKRGCSAMLSRLVKFLLQEEMAGRPEDMDHLRGLVHAGLGPADGNATRGRDYVSLCASDGSTVGDAERGHIITERDGRLRTLWTVVRRLAAPTSPVSTTVEPPATVDAAAAFSAFSVDPSVVMLLKHLLIKHPMYQRALDRDDMLAQRRGRSLLVERRAEIAATTSVATWTIQIVGGMSNTILESIARPAMVPVLNALPFGFNVGQSISLLANAAQAAEQWRGREQALGIQSKLDLTSQGKGVSVTFNLRKLLHRWPRSRHVEHGVVMDDVIDWLSCSSIHMRTVARHPQTIPKTTTLHPGPRRTGRRQLLENLLADAPIEREHLMHEAESVLQRSVEPVLFAFS